MKNRMVRKLTATVLTAVMLSGMTGTWAAAAESGTDSIPAVLDSSQPGTDFVTSKTDMDELLKRDYVDNVPLGYCEDVFSLYQPGWGFDREDVYRTGMGNGFGMPVTVKVNGVPAGVEDAEFTPSYVTSVSECKESTLVNHALGASEEDTDGKPYVQASFSQEKWTQRLKYAFDGDTSIGSNNSWSTFRENDDKQNHPQPEGGDWVSVDFKKEVSVDSIAFYIFTDPNAKPPVSAKVEYQDPDGKWAEVPDIEQPTYQEGKNVIRFPKTTASGFRLTLDQEKEKCLVITEIEFLETIPMDEKVAITGHKYISPDSRLVSMIEATNSGEQSVDVTVRAYSDAVRNVSEKEKSLTGTVSKLNACIRGDDGFAVDGTALTKTLTLAPGETRSFRVAMALSSAGQDDNQTKLDAYFADKDPLQTQKEEFNSWFEKKIPYVDLPDEQMKQIYYFRWYTYRNNIRKVFDQDKNDEEYYMITEFLPNVFWAGKNNSINCAVGLHVAEGRWLKDNTYLDDYLVHWLDRGGDIRSYSTWIADAYYNRYLVTGDKFAFDYVGKMKDNYEKWDTEKKRYNAEMGIYWQNPDRDAMEHCSSTDNRDAYRAPLNAYLYGDAMAISRMSAINGDEKSAKEWEDRAKTLQEKYEKWGWNQEDRFYYPIERTKVSEGQIKIKEAIGYTPWCFNMAPDDEEHAATWEYLVDEEYFASEYGPRTCEKKYAKQSTNYGSTECNWNGPSWPYATTQSLVGMANLLNNYKNNNAVDKTDYFSVLKTYTKSHYKNGAPWLAEDLDAENGTWIADEKRSPNYNHSEYCDLIITGLLGIRPDETDTLTMNPMIPDDWDYFCLENVMYRGKQVTMLYDRDGTHYNAGKGFKVYFDGKLVMEKDQVEKTAVSLNGTEADADRSLLQMMIQYAEDQKGTAAYEDLGKEEKQAYDQLLKEAEGVCKDKEATQAEIDAAARELAKAVSKLEAAGSKEDLEAVIQLAETFMKGYYTETSRAELRKTIDAAQAVMNDQKAAREEISQALEDITKAMASLKERADYIFKDISSEDWFLPSAQFVFDKGIMTGVDQTHFGPDTSLSRAQFATILYRMEGSPEVEYKAVFDDVADGEFYTGAVVWANENDIINGYGDSKLFGTNDEITREQMAVMMYRYAQYKGYEVSVDSKAREFTDEDQVSGFAEKAVEWAVARELITGDGGRLNPQGNTSRAVCATIIQRFIEKVSE